MPSPIALVGQYDSPFVRRVAISMHLLDVPFERRFWSVFANEDKVRTANPLGRVPVLMTDEGNLVESSAILDWLDQAYGRDLPLVPAAGTRRRDALQSIARAIGTVEKAVALLYEHKFRAEQYRDPQWIDRLRRQLTAGLASMEAAPPADAMDQVAVTTAVVYRFVQEYLPAELGDHPRLADHSRCCEEHPSFLSAPFEPD